jgi:hypothetical protein
MPLAAILRGLGLHESCVNARGSLEHGPVPRENFNAQVTHFVAPIAVRCSAADYDEQLRVCHAEFRRHCIQRHRVQEWDMTSHVHLDWENWLLTLIKT